MRLAVPIVSVLVVLHQPAAAQGVIGGIPGPSVPLTITSHRTQDGTQYVWQAPAARVAALPSWTSRAGRPPLTLEEALELAQSSLRTRVREVEVFEVNGASLSRIQGLGISDKWYYRLDFDPVVANRRLSGGGNFIVVVLLDGSIVEPTVSTPGQTPSRGAAAQQPGAAPPVSGPVRVGSTLAAPTKTRHVNPVYPLEALSAKLQGLVVLEAVIGPDGKVTDAQVVRSVPEFDRAAIDAVRQWEFTPTVLNGQPVSVVMTVTVQFSLR